MGDFLSFGSVSIKHYKWDLVEHFERGMVRGQHGHVFDVSGKSHTEFLQVLNWAYTHDAISQKIAQRASAYIKWALSDVTSLCYAWKLLTKYSSLNNYTHDKSKLPALGFSHKGIPLNRALWMPRKEDFSH